MDCCAILLHFPGFTGGTTVLSPGRKTSPFVVWAGLNWGYLLDSLVMYPASEPSQIFYRPVFSIYHGLKIIEHRNRPLGLLRAY